MAWQPAPIKVQCPKCKAAAIFAPKSDVIAFFPHCRKCGMKMEIAGKPGLWDWVKNPIVFKR